MFKVGDVCVKIAGRDAGKTCVVVDTLESGLVLVEGATRRRKCNTRHLEPTGKSLDVKKGASHEAVMKALGLEPVQRKPKKAGEKPRVQRKATASGAPGTQERKAPKKGAAGKAAKPKAEPAGEKPAKAAPKKAAKRPADAQE